MKGAALEPIRTHLIHAMAGADSHLAAFTAKMREAGLSAPAIRQFQHNYENLLAGQSGFIAESEIQPIESLPSFENIPEPGLPAGKLLNKQSSSNSTAVLGQAWGWRKPNRFSW